MDCYDINAEEIALSCMMFDSKFLETGILSLREIDFFETNNKKIFQAINNIFGKIEINLMSVSDELKKISCTLPSSIINAIPSVSVFKTCITKIRNLSYIRARRIVCQEILDYIDINNNIQDVSKYSDSRIMQLLDRSDEKKEKMLSEATIEAMKKIDRVSKGDTGLKTGYNNLDNIIIGLEAGELIIIAGRPSMGKTQLACGIMKNITDEKGKFAMFYSLEMTAESVARRYLSDVSDVDYSKIRKAELTDSEAEKIYKASEILKENGIIIYDGGSINIDELCRSALISKRKYNYDLLVIDHLGYIYAENAGNKNEAVGVICKKIKSLAKNLSVPVILLSQLSRKVEDRADRIPQLSDLRDSGEIEQDADVVLMLYREEYYNPESSKKGIAEILIKKGRDIGTGKVDMLFIPEKMRYMDIPFHGYHNNDN